MRTRFLAALASVAALCAAVAPAANGAHHGSSRSPLARAFEIQIISNIDARYKVKKYKMRIRVPDEVVAGQPFVVRVNRALRKESLIMSVRPADCPDRVVCFATEGRMTPADVTTSQRKRAKFLFTVPTTYERQRYPTRKQIRKHRAPKPTTVPFTDGQVIELFAFSEKDDPEFPPDVGPKGQKPLITLSFAHGERRTILRIPGTEG